MWGCLFEATQFRLVLVGIQKDAYHLEGPRFETNPHGRGIHRKELSVPLDPPDLLRAGRAGGLFDAPQARGAIFQRGAGPGFLEVPWENEPSRVPSFRRGQATCCGRALSCRRTWNRVPPNGQKKVPVYMLACVPCAGWNTQWDASANWFVLVLG